MWKCYLCYPLQLSDVSIACFFLFFKNNHHISNFIQLTHGYNRSLSPKQVGLLWFLWTAGEAKDLEHIWEGTAISRLVDEDSTSQEKDQEGHSKAHSGNDVAKLKAEILLDVGHTSQRQDSS